MKRVTIYDNYYKDTVMQSYTLNTIEAKDFINQILSGTHYDILITNREDIENGK